MIVIFYKCIIYLFGYEKIYMIKKLLLTFWIIVLWFISFSYATWEIRDNGWYFYSTVDTNLLLNVVNKWQLMTQRFWQTRRMLAISSTDNLKLFFFFSLWQKPYMMIENGAWIWTKQWYLPFYYICDWFSGDTFEQTNCVKHTVWDDFATIMWWFFQSITQYDKWGYDYWSWRCHYTDIWYFSIAFNSAQYWKSVVFSIWRNSDVAGCACSETCTPLVNSLDIMYSDFTILPENALNTPPWFTPVWSWWSNNDIDLNWSIEFNIDYSVTWDYVYSDCTWNDLFIALESEWYNKYMCYWWLDNFSDYDSSLTYSPIPWSGLTLQQIWWWSWSRAWDTFSEWFTFWNWLYIDDGNDYNAMWESYPAVFRTYFQLYNTYKWDVLDPRTVLEYCNIKLVFTGDTLNQKVDWYFKPACQTIVNEKQTWVWQSRVDWTLYSWWWVVVGVNWNWVWNISWSKLQWEWMTFIQDFFNLTKSKLITNFPNWYDWVLPSYIVVFLLAIILFRFLQH